MPADNNRGSLAIKAESSFGTAPTTAYDELPFTSESLGFETTAVMSREIRSDRAVVNRYRVNQRASGGIECELRAGVTSFDNAIQYGLLSDSAWSTSVTTGALTTVAFSATDNSVTRSSGSFVTDGFAVGDMVRISGSSANSMCARVAAITAFGAVANGKMILSGFTVTTESSGPSITIKHNGAVSTGKTLTTCAIDRNASDLSGRGSWNLFTGVGIDSLDIRASSNSIVTMALGLVAKTKIPGSAQTGSSTNAAAASDAFNTVDNIEFAGIGGYGTVSVVSAITNGTPSTFTTGTTQHGLRIGDTVVVFQNSASAHGMTGAPVKAVVASVPTVFTFTLTSVNTTGTYSANTLSVVRITTGSVCTGFSLGIRNGLRPRDRQFATLGAQSMGTGTSEISGTFQQYYADDYIDQLGLNWSDSSIEVVFLDAANQGYGILIPSNRVVTSRHPVSGQNADTMLDSTFETYRNATLGYQAKIWRLN